MTVPFLPGFLTVLLPRTDAGDGRVITYWGTSGMLRFDFDGSSDESAREEDLHDSLHRPL